MKRISPKMKCYYHTKRRIQERYDIDVSYEEYEHMLQSCDTIRTLVIHRDDGSSLHEVVIQDTPVLVLLDATGTLIKTAYPPDADLLKSWMKHNPAYGEWE